MTNKIFMGVVTCLLLVGAGCAQATKPESDGMKKVLDPVKIEVGLIGDFTSKYSNESDNMRRGISLATDFLKIERVTTVKKEAACNLEEITGAVDFLTKEGVNAVIINICDELAPNTAKMLQDKKITSVFIGSSNMEVEKAGDYIFSMISESASTDKKFVNEHFEKFGNKPGIFSTEGYNAIKLLSLLADKGVGTSKMMKDEIISTEFDGVGGTIYFNVDGLAQTK